MPNHHHHRLIRLSTTTTTTPSRPTRTTVRSHTQLPTTDTDPQQLSEEQQAFIFIILAAITPRISCDFSDFTSAWFGLFFSHSQVGNDLENELEYQIIVPSLTFAIF